MGAATDQSEGEHHRHRTVLLVEDDVLVRLSTADYLRSQGYHVIEAGTVVEAGKVLSSGTPVDVVFSDVDLPGATGGLSLAVWLHANYPTIPVILTSGVRAVMPNLSNQRVVPFVPKPYDLNQVAALISSLIQAGAARSDQRSS
jgi:DNA-binding NtrC family response regulator